MFATFPARTSRVTKWVVLFALTAQNTALVLLSKFAFAHTGASVLSVISCSELCKLATSCFLLLCTEGKYALGPAIEGVRTKPFQCTLPALLYVVQNSLLFAGVRLLSPTVFMVCSQMKIITSAFFSTVLLKTHVTRRQCVALVLLVLGMILVQQSEYSSYHWESQSSSDQQVNRDLRVLKGTVYVFAASLISGFTGAFLERLYKITDTEGTHVTSIWLRNTQLAMISVPVAFLNSYLFDNRAIRTVGILHDFDLNILVIIILQAVGGLLVASVMRYASNVLKCFAVSLSICCCAIITIGFSAKVNSIKKLELLFGLVLVTNATFLFSV